MGGGRVLALPLRGFYLDLRAKSIRLSHGRSIREKHTKGRQLSHDPGAVSRMQRNRDPEERVGWDVARVSGEGEPGGEAASAIRAQLPALICTEFSQLQFPNLSGKSEGTSFWCREGVFHKGIPSSKGQEESGDAVSQQSAG